MTSEQDIRRQVYAELDALMPDIVAGRHSMYEILIRPYRRPGQQVASNSKRDPQQMEKLAIV